MWTVKIDDGLIQGVYTIRCPQVYYYKTDCTLHEAVNALMVLFKRYPRQSFHVQWLAPECLSALMEQLDRT